MALPTIESFAKKSEEHETRFDILRAKGDDDPERRSCMAEIEAWLRQCVDHGHFLPERSTDRKALQSLVNYWTSQLRRSGLDVEGIGLLDPFDPEAGIPLEADCPYPGLEAYDEKNAANFFGRDKDIDDCLEHLKNHPILLILGGSGSGKSSLAKAGVLPKLKQLADFSVWQFTPGADPFLSLGRAVASILGNGLSAEKIADQFYKLASDEELPKSFQTLLTEYPAGKLPLLFVDQFEELLTLCQDAQKQKAFGDLLCALAAIPGESVEGQSLPKFPCRILLTLRTDHFARFENNNSLKPLHDLLVGKKHIKQLGGIGFDGIREAIENPAKKVGLRFASPTIVDMLASQTASLAGGLPLLQFALLRLWDGRPKDGQGKPLDFIDQRSVDALPDVQNALGRVAENLYTKFDEKNQKLCERLLLELVVLDEDFEAPLRRRRSKSRLLEILKKDSEKGWDQARIDNVIDVFVENGLLRCSGMSESQQIEVAHEAMFRNWPRFVEWISGPDAKKRLHAVKLIGREAADWRKNEDKGPQAYLKLSGEPLQAALGYLREDWLADRDAMEYVNACQKHEEERSEQVRQAERDKKRANEEAMARLQAEAAEAKASEERSKAEAETKMAKAALAEAEAQKTVASAKLSEMEAEKKVALADAKAAVALAEKAKSEKQFMRRILSVIVLLVVGSFLLFWWQQHSANIDSAHNSLPWSAKSLPPAEAVDLAYKVSEKRKEFRYDLAHSIEIMDDTQRFGKGGPIVFEGQGSAVFQFDYSNSDDKKLYVYRVCLDGKIDDGNPATIPLGDRTLAYADIGPDMNFKDPKAHDDRLIFLPYVDKNHNFKVEASQLSWQNKPNCDEQSKEKDDPKQMPIPLKTDNAQNVSFFAFDANSRTAAFSTWSNLGPDNSQSRLWMLKQTGGNWGLTEISSPGNVTQGTNDEKVVTAVAFFGGVDKRPEDRLITGRLDGSIFCGTDSLKPPTHDLHKSPIKQISSDSRPEGGDSFAYLLNSGKIYAWNCRNEHPYPLPLEESTPSVSLSYFPAKIFDKTKTGSLPLMTYVDGRKPKCLSSSSEEPKPKEYDCSPPTLAFVNWIVANDGTHVLAIESESRDAVLRLPLKLSDDSENKWEGQIAGNTSILWQKTEATGAPPAHVDWTKETIGKNFEPYKPKQGIAVYKTALSPTGKFMASIEDSKDRDINNIRTRKLGDVDPKSGPESTACQLSSDKNVAALAVDDTGTTALVTGKSLNIFPVGESTEEKNPPRCDTKDVLSKLTDKIGNNPVQNEDLTCLSFSPDGKLLVVGTQGGSLHLLKKIDNNFDSIQFSGKADFKTQTNIVKDCAVSDKGTVVGGFGDGNVWLMWLDKEEDKSPQKVQLSGEAYQVRVPVKALSMDAKGKYVAVLSEWQPSGCTRSGLPGQSIRIWDLESKEPKEQVTPVSVQCFPNRRITTIGAITAPDNPVENMWLPVMFGEQLERVPCLACARPKESSDEVLERLRSEAKPLISKSIDEKGLLERYGIHL